MKKNPLSALTNRITSTRGIHCGHPGVLSKIKLSSVGTPDGVLSVTLDVFISDTGNFSISGMSWLNRREHNGGQIKDTLKEWADHCAHEEIRNAALWILKVWELYHLNDMKAGTPEQHAALSDMSEVVYPEDWYTKACNHLKAKGLYVVELDGTPYKFGSRWLTHTIPAEDLTLLREGFAPSIFPHEDSVL